jgi:hypothetical protein
MHGAAATQPGLNAHEGAAVDQLRERAARTPDSNGAQRLGVGLWVKRS